MSAPDKAELLVLIENFKKLEWPDQNLTEKILDMLGIHDIVELGFCLNKRIPRERLAAMNMVERHLEDLTNGDHKRWADAKDTLRQLYYKVYETDEEA
jgi:hypothetical protein